MKWFDPTKGFGFILPDSGGPDILLHANVLRAFGQSSVGDGAAIVVEVSETPRGLQAAQVVSIEAPPMALSPEMEELAHLDPEEVARLAL